MILILNLYTTHRVVSTLQLDVAQSTTLSMLSDTEPLTESTTLESETVGEQIGVMLDISTSNEDLTPVQILLMGITLLCQVLS